jgi:hypothetical protein
MSWQTEAVLYSGVNRNPRNTVNWKRIVLAAARFGAGFAIFATVIGAGIYWKANRPKPWVTTAITSKFKKQVIYENRDKPNERQYYVNVYFDVSNNTGSDYVLPVGAWHQSGSLLGSAGTNRHYD